MRCGFQLKLRTRPFTLGHNGGLLRQVGTWEDTEGILFCGFRLHKHHYHLPDLELLRCSAATPILSETLNGDARGLAGTWAIESTKRIFFVCVRVARLHVCYVCLRAGAHIYVRELTQ